MSRPERTQLAELQRAKQELEDKLHFIEQLIEAIPSPVFYKDENGRYLGCNRAYAKLAGTTREELIGKTASDIWPKDSADKIQAIDEELLKNPGIHESQEYESSRRAADGTSYDMLVRKTTFLKRAGSTGGILGTMWDITEQRKAERSLRESEERFRKIVELMPVPIGIYDLEGRLVYINGKFVELLRYRIEDIPSFAEWKRRAYPDEEYRAEASVTWGEDIRRVREGEITHSPVREYRISCGDGVVRNIEVAFSLVSDHFFVSYNDVTERNRAEHQLREVLRTQALHDPLTSLYNRRHLDDILGSEFSRATRSRASIGLVMGDIDHFKRVNDTFGHDGGDEVLRAVAQLLFAQFRKGDIVCRYGGEEFTIVMPGATLKQAYQRAVSVCDAIRDLKISCDEGAVGPVTMSFGVAAFPQHGDAPDIVLKAADAALLRAKMEGRDQVIVAGSYPNLLA